MTLRIDRFWLDENTRTLTSETGVQAIRPKTLALLLYLIEHRSEIVSKSQLLNDIWDDVNVNEGVIFQSIREIRQLFGELVVVLNHPRKGYQWVGPLTPLAENISEDHLVVVPASSPTANKTERVWYVSALLVLATVITLFWLIFKPVSSAPALLIMPINNYLDTNEHQWLASSGASNLQTILAQNLPELAVLTKPSTPALTSDNNETKANWLLWTSYYGDVHDYMVVYKLQHENRVDQGVIFAHSIANALQLLADVAAKIIQAMSGAVLDLAPEIYQDADFAQAMIAYETDWHAAISHMQTYLQQHPENARAHLYLSRLYIWNHNQQSALEVVTAGLELPNINQEVKAELLFNVALIQQHSLPEEALGSIAQALLLTELADTWLTRAKLETLRADIHYQQKQLVPALRAYLRAQSFFEQIQSPINVAGIKLKLAHLYSENQQTDMAKRAFLEAKTMIQQKDMSFLYADLIEFEMQHQDLLH
jgi:DNA-binding winged helix-turn-helix (wHTH) protein/tetratricopeptide (TPR) repeat protein